MSHPRLSILHVITSLDRGGCENLLAALAMRQKAAGCEVTVAYLKGDGYWAPYLRRAEVAVVPLGLRGYGDLAPLWRLRKIIRQLRPDVIHAHLQPAEVYSVLAMAGLRDSPAFIIGKHNDEPFYNGPGERLVGRCIGRRAEKVIVVSDAVKKFIRAHHSISEGNIATIHYGIDPGPFEQVEASAKLAVRSQWGVPDDALLIGTAARFAEQKALHVLLDGYARFRQAATMPSRLVLLGRGPLEQELKDQARQLNIADAVIWPGFRTDMQVVMNALDVFALTSVREALGLVLLEAMSASKPVIATAVGGIPEIVADGETGLLCRANNAQDVADAMHRCQDAALRAKLGAAGHEKVRTEFGLAHMVAKVAEVYEFAVANHGRKLAARASG